jgi:hypothetical protein
MFKNSRVLPNQQEGSKIRTHYFIDKKEIL